MTQLGGGQTMLLPPGQLLQHLQYGHPGLMQAGVGLQTSPPGAQR